MPAFVSSVHLRWVRVRLARAIRTPTLWTLPTLTKAVINYCLARPSFAQSVKTSRRVGHPADLAYWGIVESTRASTSTGLPEASVTVAWRTTMLSALPRRTSAYMAPNSPDSRAFTAYSLGLTP